MCHEQTSKGYDQGYGGIDGDLPREPHRRKARERSALPVSEAAYEGGEFLGAVARLDITDHTTPMKTANAPAMVVHSSDVK